jgi:hypothetical protein
VCMYEYNRMKKSSGFLCFALSFLSVALWDFEARRETRETRDTERHEREKTPRGFSEKEATRRAKKVEREKKIRATQKKKERRRKKNVDESSVSRAVVVHRRERVGTEAVARGDRRKRRRAFV